MSLHFLIAPYVPIDERLDKHNGYDLTVCSFLKWRVGLMERSVQKLDLPNATKPIPNFGEGHDPYQGYQVHDYLQVSFLRQDPRKLRQYFPQ